MRLLYRNTRDGSNIESFHKYCDGNLNTLTLVQSNFGNAFGGFTAKDWGSKIGWIEDDLAFLFRIKARFTASPKIYNHLVGLRKKIVRMQRFAIQQGQAWGGGQGHDLCFNADGTAGYSKLGNNI